MPDADHTPPSRRPDDPTSWLDSAQPHDPQRSEAQVRGVQQLLGPSPKRVLELGCGEGRLLVELARDHHHVIGIDRDETVLSRCRRTLDDSQLEAELIETDFLNWMRSGDRGVLFDAILCLGNTLMTIAEIDDAIELLSAARQRLTSTGCVAVDDMPHDLWPELTEGNWQTGLSEDLPAQLIWHPHDSVFTIRRGDAIDPESWSLKPTDTLYRMWTSSALTMAARLAGLRRIEHIPEAGLILLRA